MVMAIHIQSGIQQNKMEGVMRRWLRPEVYENVAYVERCCVDANAAHYALVTRTALHVIDLPPSRRNRHRQSSIQLDRITSIQLVRTDTHFLLHFLDDSTAVTETISKNVFSMIGPYQFWPEGTLLSQPRLVSKS